jgi:hypothetical protein
MGSDDLLSPELSTTYHRAYALATELLPDDHVPVASGHRTGLARDWVLDSLLARVLRRLGGSNHEDMGLILMAVRDVLEHRRPATTRLTGAGPL